MTVNEKYEPMVSSSVRKTTVFIVKIDFELEPPADDSLEYTVVWRPAYIVSARSYEIIYSLSVATLVNQTITLALAL